MTGHPTQYANEAKLYDLHRHAETRRGTRSALSARREARANGSESIAIRHATDADRAVLARLAALDSAPAPSGEVLLAEVGDEPRVAIEIASGATIADPFWPTAQLVKLVRLWAAQVRTA